MTAPESISIAAGIAGISSFILAVVKTKKVWNWLTKKGGRKWTVGFFLVGVACLAVAWWINDANSFKDIPAKNIADGKTFMNEEVVLDGTYYVNCKFTNCKIKYLGRRPPQVVHCEITGCIFWSPKLEINCWIQMSQAISEGVGGIQYLQMNKN